MHLLHALLWSIETNRFAIDNVWHWTPSDLTLYHHSSTIFDLREELQSDWFFSYLPAYLVRSHFYRMACAQIWVSRSKHSSDRIDPNNGRIFDGWLVGCLTWSKWGTNEMWYAFLRNAHVNHVCNPCAQCLISGWTTKVGTNILPPPSPSYIWAKFSFGLVWFAKFRKMFKCLYVHSSALWMA